MGKENSELGYRYLLYPYKTIKRKTDARQPPYHGNQKNHSQKEVAFWHKSWNA
jgi:hypothetical protein